MGERLAYVSTRGRAPERGFTDILLQRGARRVYAVALSADLYPGAADLARPDVCGTRDRDHWRYATDLTRTRIAELSDDV